MAKFLVAVALFCVAAHAQIRISQTSLTFNAPAGGDSAPPQSIIVTSTTQTPIRFTVSGDGSNWLSVKPPTAVTPARISVSVDPSALVVAPYQARILISDSTPGYSAQAVDVRFNVLAGPPVLDAAPDAVRLNGRDLEDTIFVRNAGGGGGFRFTVALLGAGSWIASVNPTEGAVRSNVPVPIRIRANPTGLRPGAYRAVLRFTSPAGEKDVPVSLFLGGPGPFLATQPRGVQFEARQGAGASFTRRILILNKGTDSMSWTAELLQGSDWVKLNGTSGVSTAARPGSFTISTDIDRLSTGVHYALMKISAPQSPNSPLLFPIVSQVLDASTPARPAPFPAGLFFAAVRGLPPPPPQLVQVFTSSAQPIAYQASAVTDEGSGWLVLSNTTGVASTARPGQVSVSVNHANLQPGIYTGEIPYSFSSPDVRAVNVTLAVLPTGARLSASKERQATGCNPTRLAMTQSGLTSNFSAAAGWPTPLTIQLTDDCGTPVLNGQVVLTYSNGDPAQTMTLSDPDDGSYSATWVPARDSATMSITARATAAGVPAALTQLTGTILPNKVPILFQDGTVNNRNVVKGGALAPGTVASLFGSGLAAAERSPGVVPLTTNVNGTRVLIGGIEAPLFFVSDGQINAQIPIELAPDRQYQVLVSANGAFTVPDTIAVTAVQPGLAVFDSDSRVIAHNSSFGLIGPSAPARPGDAIVLYLVGMGQTNPPVLSGAAAPATSLANAMTQPTVTIDGKQAEIFFAGLTPGSVGLYQINLRVPADSRTGDLPVTISQGGVLSNPGVLPVR